MMHTSTGASTSASNLLPVLSRATNSVRFLDLRPYFSYPTFQKNMAQPVASSTADSKGTMPPAMADASIVPEVGSIPPEKDLEKQQPSADHDDAKKDDDIKPDLALTRKPSEVQYPPFKQAAIIMLSLYLTIFLVALDRTIIGTAIPRMTDEFHSFDDIGWYASAYMLTTCGFQLFYGKIYTYYSPKWVYLIAIGLFEVGSAVCGAAPTSSAFIVGRAISGVGCAGIFSGAMVIVFSVLPLEKRPVWMGLNGAMFGIASVVGPLLGGVFTTYATWRWCFYINLPIGAITAVVVLLVLKIDRPMAASGKSVKQKILQLDPLGTACFLPGIVCLLLALQWGGSKYEWNDGRIIALFVVFGVLILAFVLLQIFRDDDYVTVPTRVITNRSVAAAFWYTICIGGTLSVAVYYLPIYFQAIKGVNAVQSGIRSIPLVLALVVAVILTGIGVGKIGYYTPFIILSSIITPIGLGLICTYDVNTGHAKWIGYQVLLGFGLGCGMQQSNMAAQTVLPRKDASAGMALMFFGQSLGGSVFVSVAQNVLNNKLISNLRALHLPNFKPEDIVNTGATDLRNLVPSDELPRLLVAYNDAIKHAFYLGVALAALSILGSASMEWKSVKKARQQMAGMKGGPGGPPATAAAAAAATTPPIVVEEKRSAKEKEAAGV